jgi:co-chaperonin GroES (HSP10)
MANTSGIHPKGPRLLVKPLEIDNTTKSGIILSTHSEKEREQMANTTGEVIDMGEECFDHSPNAWCAVGDRIVFSKYAGLLYLGKDGKQYRLINDDNVVATLDGDVKLVDPHLSRGLQN